MRRFIGISRLQFGLWLWALLGLAVAADPPSLTPEQQAKLAEALKLNGQAVNLYDQGKYADAEKLCRQALEIDEKYLGEDHPHTAQVVNNLGLLAETQLRYAEAVPLYERALKIREKALGPNHLDVAVTLRNIAGVDHHLGKYEKAGELYRRALSIYEKMLGPNHLDVANCLNDLAVLYEDEGNYSQAEPLLERSLRIQLNRFGPGHPELATSLHNLACNFDSQGKYGLAEGFFQEALRIQEKALGPDHPDVALTLDGLHAVYCHQQRFDQAEPLCRRALQITEKSGGANSLNYANELNNLGDLRDRQGKNSEAEQLYQRALGIREKILGLNHLDLAPCLNNLGYLNCKLGKYAQAKAYYERAMTIRKAVLAPDHPDLALSATNMTSVDVALGDWHKAADHFDLGRRIIRRHIARVLPALSPAQQARFLQTTDEGEFYGCLSLGVKKCDDPAIVELSTGWLLNGKAVAQEALAQNAQLTRDSADPKTADAVSKLLDVRRQLASLVYSGADPGQEEQRKAQVDDLQDQEAELSRQIAEAHGEAFQSEPWIELAAVRNAIPSDAALVNIAKFDVVDFQSKRQEDRFLGYRYAAWVVPPAGQGEIRIIDLGNADKIDAAAKAVGSDMERAIQALSAAGLKSNVFDHAAQEKVIQSSLAKLAEMILAPVLKDVPEGTKQLIVSPDSQLWKVPWAALPLADGRYAIEQYQIRYSVSGRDLIAREGGNQHPTPPVMMADPDYDLKRTEMEKNTRSVLRGMEMASNGNAELRSVVGSTSVSSALRKVPRLPGTKAEAEAIGPKIASYAHQEQAVYTDRWALEGVFKKLHGPRLLVLATHGFFLDDQEAKLDDTAGLANGDLPRSAKPVLTVGGEPVENPLLRCGLLLAGCNSSGQPSANGAAAGGAATDDGILTGMEIVGTDLRGTELVVLSACETALGEVQNGEGVAGLRQAFQLAGAKTVVATLWQIPDKDSAQLMSQFFTNLAAGQAKADALRRAQLTLIEAHRQRFAAAHPFFWAAFTITGE